MPRPRITPAAFLPRLVGALLIALLIAGSPAEASTSADLVTPPGKGEIWELQGGIQLQGGTATCPGAAPVTWEAVHAAAFFEATVADMMFGKPKIEDPPAGAPRCRVDMQYRQASADPFTTFTVNYVNVGDTTWVQAPAEAWFVALPQAKKAYDGDARPINGYDASAVTSTTTATTTAPPIDAGSSDSSSSNTLPVVIVGLIGAGLIGFVVLRRRRRG